MINVGDNLPDVNMPVRVDGDFVLLTIDLDLDLAHRGVTLLVIGRVDYDLIKDLVQRRYVRNFLGTQLFRFLIEHPHLVLSELHRTHVRIGSCQYMLSLTQLLVIRRRRRKDVFFVHCLLMNEWF